MGLDAILGLILPFIPKPEDKAKAEQAIRDAYGQFLSATGGPVYAWLRAIEVGLALIDAIVFQGRNFAAAAANLSVNPFGVVELLIILWPFVGPAVVPLAQSALQAGIAGVAKGVIKPPAPAPQPELNDDPVTKGGRDV